MKRVTAILFALIFIASIAVAAEEAEAPAAANTFVGKVVAVTVADPAKGISEGVITVADAMGRTVSLTVDSTVKVLDATATAIGLDKIKINDKVKVDYEESEGDLDKATSISVTK